MNKIAGKEDKPWRDRRQQGRRERANCADKTTEIKHQPDNTYSEEGRNQSDGKCAQPVFAVQDAVESGGEQSKVIERGSMVVGRIIVVEPAAEQAGHKKPIHSFIMVERFFRQVKQTQQAGAN